MTRAKPIALLATLIVAGVFACKRADYTGPSDYDTPQHSPAQLQELITQQCRATVTNGRPLLLELSASWCSDCRTLATMKKQEPLASTLARQVNLVEINVGDFERHKEIIDLYDVNRIAAWVMLKPTDCAAPMKTWPVLGNRSVEPNSRGAGTAELVKWLTDRAGG